MPGADAHGVRENEQATEAISKQIDVEDCPKTKVRLSPLQYDVNKPETSYAELKLIATNKEGGKFQQIVFGTYNSINCLMYK